MDIELAIERMLVINHIKSRPEIMNMYTQSGKMGPIPGFTTTPYVIDFGVVITGSTVSMNVYFIAFKIFEFHRFHILTFIALHILTLPLV